MIRRAVGLLVLVCALAGCTRPNATVSVVNDLDHDVVVRVEYQGGSRQVRVPAGGDGEVIHVRAITYPASVLVFDAATCALLGSDSLPREAAWVATSDNDGNLDIHAYAKDVFGDTLLPADESCSGG
jgi:hypothetical protein